MLALDRNSESDATGIAYCFVSRGDYLSVLVLVAHGCVRWYGGSYLENCDEFTPQPSGTGLMVWEGKDVNSDSFYSRHESDYEPEFRGSWRRPTAEELEFLASDISLVDHGRLR